MKIIYLIDQEFPKNSQTFIINEIVELTKLGHNITILARDKTKDKIQESVIENKILDKTIFFPKYKKGRGKLNGIIRNVIKNPTSTWKIIRKLHRNNLNFWQIATEYMNLKKIIDKKFDLIHVPFSNPREIIKGHLISDILNIPLSITFRAQDLYANNITNKLKKAKNIIKKARIITISDYNKKYIQKNIIDKEVNVVHSAIDLDFFKPSSKSRIKNQIISICRFHEIKGIDYLLRALKILKKNRVKYRCTLIGDGPEKQNYEKLIKLLDIPNITFTGQLTSKEIKRHLEKSTIFVLPCIIAENGDRDILANSLKEAMAMELPVITSNICGIEELITNNKSGLLINPKDPEEIAKAIIKLLKNPKLRKKLGKNARKKIEKDFSIKTEVKKLESIFQEAVKEHKK